MKFSPRESAWFGALVGIVGTYSGIDVLLDPNERARWVRGGVLLLGGIGFSVDAIVGLIRRSRDPKRNAKN